MSDIVLKADFNKITTLRGIEFLIPSWHHMNSVTTPNGPKCVQDYLNDEVFPVPAALRNGLFLTNENSEVKPVLCEIYASVDALEKLQRDLSETGIRTTLIQKNLHEDFALMSLRARAGSAFADLVARDDVLAIRPTLEDKEISEKVLLGLQYTA